MSYSPEGKLYVTMKLSGYDYDDDERRYYVYSTVLGSEEWTKLEHDGNLDGVGFSLMPGTDEENIFLYENDGLIY